MLLTLKRKGLSILALLSTGKLDTFLMYIGKISFSLSSKAIGFVIVNSWTRLIRVHPNRIIFNTFQGVYCCNPKAITEQFIKNTDQKVEIVWVVRDGYDHDVPEGVSTVVRGTFDFFLLSSIIKNHS